MPLKPPKLSDHPNIKGRDKLQNASFWALSGGYPEMHAEAAKLHSAAATKHAKAGNHDKVAHHQAMAAMHHHASATTPEAQTAAADYHTNRAVQWERAGERGIGRAHRMAASDFKRSATGKAGYLSPSSTSGYAHNREEGRPIKSIQGSREPGAGKKGGSAYSLKQRMAKYLAKRGIKVKYLMPPGQGNKPLEHQPSQDTDQGVSESASSRGQHLQAQAYHLRRTKELVSQQELFAAGAHEDAATIHRKAAQIAEPRMSIKAREASKKAHAFDAKIRSDSPHGYSAGQGTVIRYGAAFRPIVVDQPNGKYTIRAVPIFKTHSDRGWKCDANWMRKAVAWQQAEKAKGFLPRLIKGHTKDDKNAAEVPATAALDNYSFDDKSGWLHADYTELTKDVLDQIKAGAWPGRSVEVIPDQHSIPVVAMLGGTPPYFRLPDLRFQANHAKHRLCYAMELPMAGPNDNDKNEDGTDEPQGGGEGAAGAGGADAGMDDGEANNQPVTLGQVRKIIASEIAKCMQEMMGAQGGGQADDGGAATSDVMQNADPAFQELHLSYQAQAAKIAELEDKNERAEWRSKYQALRVPATILNINDELDTLMDFPSDKRKMYFEKTTKTYARTGPVGGKNANGVAKDAVAGGAPRAGSAEEAAAIKVFYQENKARFKGDYMAAARAYKADLQKKEAAKA